MARKLPKERSLKRKGATVSPKKKIVVVCEGKNTEPEYIKAFASDKKHPLVTCEPIGPVGVPKSIVDKAIQENKKLLKQAAKSGDSFDENYEVWCVSDADEHPRLFREIQRAKDNGLMYALSNPCIELWGYLHYHQNDAPTHRHEMQKKLTKVMPNYNHKKKAIFNYEHMKGSYNDAVTRAKDLINRRKEEDTPNENPSTNLYELMDSICTTKNKKD